jgi:Peptidase inhibitor I66
MDTLCGTVTLQAGQAPLGVVDDRLFALLVDHDRAEQWVVTPVPRYGENAVVIETHDRSAGMVLPDEQPGTQVAVKPLIVGRSEPPSYPPDEIWIATPLPGAGAPDLTPNAGAFTLRPMSVGANQFIGRQLAEDLSLLPKRIVLRAEGDDPTPFIAIPSA